MTVPKLSISTKLYATFALMAIGAVLLDSVVDYNAPVWVTAAMAPSSSAP